MFVCVAGSLTLQPIGGSGSVPLKPTKEMPSSDHHVLCAQSSCVSADLSSTLPAVTRPCLGCWVVLVIPFLMLTGLLLGCYCR